MTLELSSKVNSSETRGLRKTLRRSFIAVGSIRTSRVQLLNILTNTYCCILYLELYFCIHLVKYAPMYTQCVRCTREIHTMRPFPLQYISLHISQRRADGGVFPHGGFVCLSTPFNSFLTLSLCLSFDLRNCVPPMVCCA